MLTCPAAQLVSVLVLPVTRTGAGASSAGPDPGVRPARSAAQHAMRPPLLAGQRLAHEAGPGNVAGHEIGLQCGQQPAPLAGRVPSSASQTTVPRRSRSIMHRPGAVTLVS